MSARVAFVTADDRRAVLFHGDLVGRLHSAALVLDDPRVSEAHAMVSLRGDGLYLLGLRRPVRHAGKSRNALRLEPGQRVEFASDVWVDVAEVVLPDAVPALEGHDLPRQVLPSVASLYTKPHSRLVGKFEPGASAHLWSLGEGRWRLRTADGVSTVSAGDALTVDGLAYKLAEVGLGEAAASHTVQRGGVDAPLRIIARYDTVQIQRQGKPTVLLNGQAARIISELAECGCALRWEEMCRELWPDGGQSPDQLRHRLDMALLRMRKRLKAERVRENLVQAAGTGMLELVLRSDDTLITET